jgi:hypothetical protein
MNWQQKLVKKGNMQHKYTLANSLQSDSRIRFLVCCGSFSHCECYVSIVEKGTESVTEKTGRDTKRKIKWLGMYTRLLDTLTYTLVITF